MKKLIIFLFLSNIVLAQKYVVFENNKKNKALFDYNDPNSLVSMLVQSQAKIISFISPNSNSTDIDEYSIHPIDGMLNYSKMPPTEWEIEGDDINRTKIFLYRESDYESFEQWFYRLTTKGTEPENDPLIFGALLRIDKLVLENQYNEAKAGEILFFPKILAYYDIFNITKIIISSDKIYFAKKSPYENKYLICLELYLDKLSLLGRTDYLNNNVTKDICSKLRKYQLEKMKDETSEEQKYSLSKYYSYNGKFNEQRGELFKDYDENEFNMYKNNTISKTFTGSKWIIKSIVGDILTLTRNSNQEIFEDWYKRLTIIGDSISYNPYDYEDLKILNRVDLKQQYNKALEGMAIMLPNYDLAYWVDYPDPAVYLKRSFSKDTLGKFKTNFSQLLFTERLNNKKGFDQKPQVLMSFGEGEEYGTPISPEILDLLKVELAPFNLKKEFSWQKIISTRQGKKIGNEDLKKIIHCYDINENGIQY
jgi:hypothetical protein